MRLREQQKCIENEREPIIRTRCLRGYDSISVPPVLEAAVAELPLGRAIHFVAEYAAALTMVAHCLGCLGIQGVLPFLRIAVRGCVGRIR